MEIGLVASIIQVAGAGLKLSIALYEYADGVSSADKRAKEIARDVELTSLVIQELGRVFDRDDTAGVMSNGAVATAEKAIEDCKSVFGELNVVLEKSQKKGIGKFTMPFRESKIQLLRDNLGRLKTTLQLLMQVLIHAHQVETNKEDKAEIRRQRQELKRLIELKKKSIKKYEESLKTFNSSEESTLVDLEEYTPQAPSSTMSSLKNFGLMAMTQLTPNLQNRVFAHNTNPGKKSSEGDLEKGLDLSAEMDETPGPNKFSRRKAVSPQPVFTGRDHKGRLTAQTLALCVQHIQGLLQEIEAVERGLDRRRPQADLNEELKKSYAKTRGHLDAIIDATPLAVDPIAFDPSTLLHLRTSSDSYDGYQVPPSHPGISSAEAVAPRRPTLRRKGSLGSYYSNTPYQQVHSRYDKDWGVDVTTRYEIEHWPADGRPPETEVIEHRRQVSYADAKRLPPPRRPYGSRDRSDAERRNEYPLSYSENSYAASRRERRLARARRAQYPQAVGSRPSQGDDERVEWMETAPYRGSHAGRHEEWEDVLSNPSHTRTFDRPGIAASQVPRPSAPYGRSNSEQLLRPRGYDREALPRTSSYRRESRDRPVRTYSPPSPSYSPVSPPPYFSEQSNQRRDSLELRSLEYDRFDQFRSRENMRDEGYGNTQSDDDYSAVEIVTRRSPARRDRSRSRGRNYLPGAAVAGTSGAAAYAAAAAGPNEISASRAERRRERERLAREEERAGFDFEPGGRPRSRDRSSAYTGDRADRIRTPQDIMRDRRERVERERERIALQEAKAKAEWAAKDEKSKSKDDRNDEDRTVRPAATSQSLSIPASAAAMPEIGYGGSRSSSDEDETEESSDSEGEELDDLLRDWTTVNGKSGRTEREGSKVSDD